MSIVRKIIWAKNKVCIQFPFTGITNDAYYGFGEGEYADFMGFGFSYVEHEDHLVEFIVANPTVVRKIIREIEPVQLVAGEDYVGILWTGKIHISDKVLNDQILFANSDFSVVLDLNINKMEV